MALFSAGVMIRETRKAKGLTQEQLAEGICTRETIVKLEKGTRKPNWFVFREITDRLGLNFEIFQDDISNTPDVQVIQTYHECATLLANRQFEEVKVILDRIDEEKNTVKGEAWQKGLGYLLLLVLKGGFYSLDTRELGGNKYRNPTLGIEYSLEALKLSRPDFELEKISEYFLATHECWRINTIAIAYITMGNNAMALDIMKKLKINTEKNYSASLHGSTGSWYRLLLSNLTKMLLDNELYDECLLSADEGLKITLDYDKNMIHYRNYLYCKAISLAKLGRIDEAKEFYKKALLLVYVLDGFSDLDYELDKAKGEELFGEALDLSLF